MSGGMRLDIGNLPQFGSSPLANKQGTKIICLPASNPIVDKQPSKNEVGVSVSVGRNYDLVQSRKEMGALSQEAATHIQERDKPKKKERKFSLMRYAGVPIVSLLVFGALTGFIYNFTAKDIDYSYNYQVVVGVSNSKLPKHRYTISNHKVEPVEIAEKPYFKDGSLQKGGLSSKDFDKLVKLVHSGTSIEQEEAIFAFCLYASLGDINAINILFRFAEEGNIAALQALLGLAEWDENQVIRDRLNDIDVSTLALKAAYDDEALGLLSRLAYNYRYMAESDLIGYHEEAFYALSEIANRGNPKAVVFLGSLAFYGDQRAKSFFRNVGREIINLFVAQANAGSFDGGQALFSFKVFGEGNLIAVNAFKEVNVHGLLSRAINGDVDSLKVIGECIFDRDDYYTLRNILREFEVSAFVDLYNSGDEESRQRVVDGLVILADSDNIRAQEFLDSLGLSGQYVRSVQEESVEDSGQTDTEEINDKGDNEKEAGVIEGTIQETIGENISGASSALRMNAQDLLGVIKTRINTTRLNKINSTGVFSSTEVDDLLNSLADLNNGKNIPQHMKSRIAGFFIIADCWKQMQEFLPNEIKILIFSMVKGTDDIGEVEKKYNFSNGYFWTKGNSFADDASLKIDSGVRTFVDVGCGTGTTAVALATKYPGLEVIAVDANANNLKVLFDNIANIDLPNLKIQYGDASKLLKTTPRGTIDRILFKDFFHYWKQYSSLRGLIRASIPLLSENGIIVIKGATGPSDARVISKIGSSLKIPVSAVFQKTSNGIDIMTVVRKNNGNEWGGYNQASSAVRNKRDNAIRDKLYVYTKEKRLDKAFGILAERYKYSKEPELFDLLQKSVNSRDDELRRYAIGSWYEVIKDKRREVTFDFDKFFEQGYLEMDIGGMSFLFLLRDSGVINIPYPSGQARCFSVETYHRFGDEYQDCALIGYCQFATGVQVDLDSGDLTAKATSDFSSMNAKLLQVNMKAKEFMHESGLIGSKNLDIFFRSKVRELQKTSGNHNAVFLLPEYRDNWHLASFMFGSMLGIATKLKAKKFRLSGVSWEGGKFYSKFINAGFGNNEISFNVPKDINLIPFDGKNGTGKFEIKLGERIAFNAVVPAGVESGLLQEKTGSSAIGQVPVTGDTKGGIDFRSLPIVTQAVSNLGLTASSLSTMPPEDTQELLSCIADILRKQEEECCSTDPALKDILVVLESGLS
ncbi:MAG: class I SAM-dependent methyltransferase [Candidatus Omnitrophica bacterium]|nr:class I SAM-dependent methyltransferase [Candidatus Omnitrophota bacterium]